MPGVWCVDVPTLPTYIDEGDDPYRPQVCMFVDGATGLALPPRVQRRVDAASLAAAFDEAVAGARALRIEPPTALHAESEQVAELCRAAFSDRLPIVVAPHPALAELRHALCEHLGAAGCPSYRIGRVGKSVLQAFFGAAAVYQKARPWEIFEDADVPLCLTIRALEYIDVACCVITDDGMGGLAIYRDPAQLLRAVHADDRSATGRIEMLAVAYYDKVDLPPPLANELRRLTFAPRRGPYPAVLPLDADGIPRPPLARDFSVAALALRAIAQFAEDVASDPDVQAATIRVPLGADLLEVGLQWPHPMFAS